MPKQQSLKSPLLLWITGGEILHPAFYSYLPPGLLFLCGRECASVSVSSTPPGPALLVCLHERRGGVGVSEGGRESVFPACVHALVARCDLCASVWERLRALVHMHASLHAPSPQCGSCFVLRIGCNRLTAYRSCNTFFSFNTISKPQHPPLNHPHLHPHT